MKLISTILLLFCTFGFFSQKEISWYDLRCEYIEAWSKEYQTTYMAPYFKKNHKELNNIRVNIKGYVDCIDPKNEYYIISKNHINNVGFTCSQIYNTELFEIIEVNFRQNPKKFNENTDYQVEGILILNYTDPSKLNYILKDAVILEK